MEYRVLGPLTVLVDGRPMKLGGRRQQLVLATLLARANVTVSQDSLIDNVWAGEPPEAAKSTLQSYVYGLRRALGQDAILRQGEGYRVNLDHHTFDSHLFETLVAEGKKLATSQPDRAAATLGEALSLWKGSPYEGLDNNPALLTEITRLDELRAAAIEARIEAELILGNHSEVVGELDSLVRQFPFRERFRAQQMLALYRSGRQADALRAYQLARVHLAEELGIDPSPELQELEQRILDQDSSLNVLSWQPGGTTGGSRFGPLRGYEIEEVIGSGDFGTVYRAHHSAVQREVALKVIKAEYSGHADFVRRFEREAQIVAQLDHPHIVPLYDFWREPEGAYLVMPVMRGGSLASAVGEGGWSLLRALRAVEQVGGALAHAHRRGVVHRDVKPANVLLDSEGNCYLSDFGIAQELGFDDSHHDDAMSPGAPRPGLDVAGDILGLGHLTFQLLTGVSPRLGWPVPRLADARPDLPPELGRVLAQVTSADHTATYRRVDDFVRAFKQAAGADIVPLSTEGEDVLEPARNPYKGLRAFRDTDAADFFGRDALVDELIEAVSKHNVVTVVGPSGSGKSSVVRAGLVPALRAKAGAGMGDWLVTDMFPGSHPFEELEAALLKVAVDRPSNLLAELTDEGGLLRISKRILPSEDFMLLVIVDQFEELFSTVRSETARRAFLDNLVAVASDERSRVKVVLTLRADYLDRPLSYRSFAEIVGRGMVTVGPPSRDGLAQAIAGPAQSVGVAVEPGLIGRMISDIENQPGSLPLLQFSLAELFASRVGGLLSIDGYESMGGVRRALGLRAEELYSDLTPAMQEIASQLFLRLVAITEENEAARRRVSQAELRSLSIDQKTIDLILGRFASARLVTFDQDRITRTPTVELAHEALLTEWPRLGGWVDDHRDTLIEGRRVSGLTRDWLVSGKDPSFLLRGSRLRQVEQWLESTDLALTEDEQVFIEASLDVERTENQATRRRRRLTISGLAAALGIFMVLSAVALWEWRSATTEARHVLVRDLASDAITAIDQDPELALLLALESAEISRAVGEPLDTSTTNALQAALRESRLDHRLGGEARAVEVAGPLAIALTPLGDVVAEFTGGGTAWTIDEQFRAQYIAATPDGSMLAIAYQPVQSSSEVAIWATDGPMKRFSFQAPSGAQSLRLAWSTDGRLLAVLARYSESADIALFDVGRGGEVGEFTVDGGSEIAALGQDRLVVTVPEANKVQIHGIPEGGLVSSFETPGFSPGTLASDPQGGRLVLGSNDGKRAQVWDLATEEMLWDVTLPHPAAAMVLDVSPGTETVAISASGGAVMLFDLANGSERMTLKGHVHNVTDLDFDESGQYLATSANGEPGRVWNTSPGGVEAVGAGPEAPCRVEVSPDGSMAVLTGTDGTVTIVDITAGTIVRSIPNQQVHFGQWVTVSDDWKYMAWTDEGGVARVWDTSTQEPVLEVPFCHLPKALSHDGAMLVAQANCFGQPERGTLIDTRAGEELFDLGEGLVLDAFFTSSNGSEPSRYAVLLRDVALEIYDTESGDQIVKIDSAPGDLINAAGVGTDGLQLAIGSEAGTVTVYSLPRLISGSSGDEAMELNLEVTTTVSGLAIEGNYLAVAAQGSLRVWDIPSGTLQFQPSVDIVTPPFTAFSPDGTSLIYADGGYELRRFIYDSDLLVEHARSRVSRELTTDECLTYLGAENCDEDGTA